MSTFDRLAFASYYLKTQLIDYKTLAGLRWDAILQGYPTALAPTSAHATTWLYGMALEMVDSARPSHYTRCHRGRDWTFLEETT